ncbi:PD-(D/E)XK motif protein [Tenacibaculum finnmarkense]|uniref:PD-(D/E)XK motif protein n=1 Tax=Tenacibaculum finnmarkense TaxID=2781243 RepID=UPI001E621E0F|nr:PD-(D/E)XK motif protein [Tenacibaculum finnmarkense]MCD8409894.1 PD-(D/E)XK motif protein [Tenacibaculum finnmarkense genomovar ulcerans]MCD8445848.1 PD-(D/E)XK motif protein [Tenacibaculum finnmarkense genomovar finnmarkense]
MEAIYLEDQWLKVKGGENSSFTTIKINPICKPDLYLGINDKQNRCLLLILPKGFKTHFIGESKENIKTTYIEKDNYIVLELLDNYYHNLFNDLIISLFYKVKDIDNHKESTAVFISTINKWSAFLAKGLNNRLTKEVIKGLLGELTVLNEFLKDSYASEVNNILDSWQGPYDSNTDFVFDNKNIEVKTKNLESSNVRISSEFQLDNELGKNLELFVVSLDSNPNSTLNLELIINEIKDRIIQLNGNLSILFDALSAKSLFTSNIKDYNNFKFTLKKHETYSCDIVLEDGREFPRLIKSELPNYINKLKYNINLQKLEDFVVTHKIF